MIEITNNITITLTEIKLIYTLIGIFIGCIYSYLLYTYKKI